MEHRSKYLIKNVGILAISNFSSKILVFLLVPLYTSVLSTSEYGTYDLVVSTVTFLFPVLSANIIDAVMRFSMEKIYKKEDTASIGIKYIAVSMIVFGSGLLIVYFLKILPGLNGLWPYIFFYYLFFALDQYFIQLAKGLERVQDMGIAGVISTVVTLATNIIFLLILKKGLTGFFVANILAQAVPVLYYFVRLRFWNLLKWGGRHNRLEREMLVYCVPLICTSIGWWVNSTADKYTVTFICGVAANGLLSVSYKIPSIISTLQGIFIQAWQISAIKEYGEKEAADFYGRTFLHLNLIMSGACAALIILSRPLAYILYSNDFYLAWQYVPFLLISSVLNCASGFLGPLLAAKKDSRSMALSAIYGACTNIVLNIIFVYLMGVQGATIATVISSYIIYYFRMRAVKDTIVIGQYWRVLATWGLLCVQAVIEVWGQRWYLELPTFALLLLLNKGLLTTLIKRVKKF